MSEIKAKRDVIENTKLCADQGWKGTFRFKTGEVVEKAYITGTDWVAEFISVEKVGERNLPPRLIDLKEVESVEVGWN